MERFTVTWYDSHGLHGKTEEFCVVDDFQVGSDGERLIVGRYPTRDIADTVKHALDTALLPTAATVTKIEKRVLLDTSPGGDGMVVVSAVADIRIPHEENGAIFHVVESPGLYGVDPTSDTAYLDEVYAGERETLLHMLSSLGLDASAALQQNITDENIEAATACRD